MIALTFIAVSCTISTEQHEHTFDMENWGKDAESHWHTATCEHTDEKNSIEAHTWGESKTVKAATCTENGEITYKCPVCNATKTGEIPALGHSWGKGEITENAAEGKDGTMTFTCNVCNATKTEAIPALEHKHEIEAKWSSDAESHWHAASCGLGVHSVDKDLHVWREIEVTKAATCTEPGTSKKQCTVCSYMEEKEIPATGHSLDTSKWEKDAEFHWYAASCGIEEHRAAKKPHTTGTRVTKNPTATESGTKETYCMVCNYVVKTEEIPATGGGENGNGDNTGNGNTNGGNTGGNGSTGGDSTGNGESSGGNTDSGESTGGNTNGDNTGNGNTSGGNTGSGESTGGNTSGGNSSGGESIGGNTNSDNTGDSNTGGNGSTGGVNTGNSESTGGGNTGDGESSGGNTSGGESTGNGESSTDNTGNENTGDGDTGNGESTGDGTETGDDTQTTGKTSVSVSLSSTTLDIPDLGEPAISGKIATFTAPIDRTSYEWFVDDRCQTGAVGNIFIIDTTTLSFGSHSVLVIVDGKYSAEYILKIIEE